MKIQILFSNFISNLYFTAAWKIKIVISTIMYGNIFSA